MGKTYCCSDVHAHLDVFEEALKTLNPEDKLYVIGDVVDKGPDGVKVLQKIMETENCELLIGNHDLMMLDFLTELKKYEDDPEKALRFTIYSNIGDVWLDLNDGRRTYDAFCELEKEEQKKIIEYLKNTYVLKRIEIGDKKFVLVHAVAENYGKEDVKTSDLLWGERYDWESDFVWGRYNIPVEGYTVISGHTVVQHFHTTEALTMDYDGDLVIDIDCGLAARSEKLTSRLCILCLDDMSTQYFTPKTY